MNFSASQLVKCSTSQLLYFALKKVINTPTKNQIEGNKYAEDIVKKEAAPSEKRGIVPIKDDVLFFCVDMVVNNTFIEIKQVKEQIYEDWYLHSSILQSSFYAYLLTQVKQLDTPKFRIKEGYKQEIIQIPSKFTFELWFGVEKYSIKPNKAIYKHYIKKLMLVKEAINTSDFDKCRTFDAKFKHKEFNIFSPTYTKIIKNKQHDRSKTR